jgi:hypothetical protein
MWFFSLPFFLSGRVIDYPFLQGRGFVFASQYARLLPVQLAGQYLNAAVQVIEASNASIPIKVSAVKAVHKYVQFWPYLFPPFIHQSTTVSAMAQMIQR